MGRDPPDSKSNQPRPRDGSTSAGVRSPALDMRGRNDGWQRRWWGGVALQRWHPGAPDRRGGGNPTSGSARAIISRSVDFAVVRDVT